MRLLSCRGDPCALSLSSIHYLCDLLTPSESAWDNRTCVKKHGKRYPMTNIEAKISRLLLEACEELLPKTSARNNKKINQALDLVREQLSSRKQS